MVCIKNTQLELSECIEDNEVELRKPKFTIKKLCDSYCELVFPTVIRRCPCSPPRNKERSILNVIFPPPGQPIDNLDGDYEREMAKVWPPPVFLFLFTIIQAAVFLIDYLLQYYGYKKQLNEYLIYDPHNRDEVWRFLTYMFVHEDFKHLMENIFFQLILGLPLEIVNGWRILIVYLYGGIAASLSESLFSPADTLKGASGGVYALLASYFAIVLLNWRKMDSKFIQLTYIITFILYDIANILTNGTIGRVGYYGHLFGGIIGLLIGIGVLRNLDQQRWQYICWSFCMVIIAVLTTFGITIHIVCPGYFQANKTKNISCYII